MKSKLFKRTLILLSLGLFVFGLIAYLFPPVRRALLNTGAMTWTVEYYNKYRPKYIALKNDEDCFNDLTKRGIEFKKLKSSKNANGCHLSGHLKIERLGKFDLSSPVMMTCQMTLQLHKFLTERVDPAGQAYFQENIRFIKHIGTYNCRSDRGMKSLLSEHAFANAIDILGFTTENGKAIVIEKDWTAKNQKAKFLHQIGSSACNYFSIALGPNYDRLHHNHFHFDMAPFNYCGH